MSAVRTTLACLTLASLVHLPAGAASGEEPCPQLTSEQCALDDSLRELEKSKTRRTLTSEKRLWHLVLGELELRANAGVTDKFGDTEDGSGNFVEEIDDEKEFWNVQGGFYKKKLFRDLWVALSPESYLEADKGLVGVTKEQPFEGASGPSALRSLFVDRITVDATVGYGRTLERAVGDEDPKFDKQTTFEVKVGYTLPLDKFLGVDID